jgi:hypothetical protein
MLAQVHALLTGLAVAGFKLDPRKWLAVYATATIAPYLLIGVGFWLFVGAPWLGACVAIYAVAAVIEGMFDLGRGPLLYMHTALLGIATLAYVCAGAFSVIFDPGFYAYLTTAVSTAIVYYILLKLTAPLIVAHEGNQRPQDEYGQAAQKALDEGGHALLCCGMVDLAYFKPPFLALWLKNLAPGLLRSLVGQAVEIMWWLTAGDRPDDVRNVLYLSTLGPVAFVLHEKNVSTSSLFVTWAGLNDMAKLSLISFFALAISPWAIYSTWNTFLGISTGIDAGNYVHMILSNPMTALAFGNFEITLGVWDFDPRALWRSGWSDLEGLLFDAQHYPSDKLLEVSKTLTGLGFAGALLRILTSLGATGVFSVLQLLPVSGHGKGRGYHVTTHRGLALPPPREHCE